MTSPLSIAKVAYQVIQHTTANTNFSIFEESNQITKTIWVVNFSNYIYYIDMVLPLHEYILESLTESDRPWDDFHRQYYFLPTIDKI